MVKYRFGRLSKRKSTSLKRRRVPCKSQYRMYGNAIFSEPSFKKRKKNVRFNSMDKETGQNNDNNGGDMEK
jgi:hypothetical protein